MPKTGIQSEQQLAHIKDLATIQGINDAFLVATGFAVIGFILSFFIKRPSPAAEETHTADKSAG